MSRFIIKGTTTLALLLGLAGGQLKKLPTEGLFEDSKSAKSATEFKAGDDMSVTVDSYLMPMYPGGHSLGKRED